MRHCGGEFSDGTVILASLIAAAGLRPKEQLLNRVTERQKHIASGSLAFLSRFHDSVRWLRETDKTEAAATIEACPGSGLKGGGEIHPSERAIAHISERPLSQPLRSKQLRGESQHGIQ